MSSNTSSRRGTAVRPRMSAALGVCRCCVSGGTERHLPAHCSRESSKREAWEGFPHWMLQTMKTFQVPFQRKFSVMNCLACICGCVLCCTVTIYLHANNRTAFDTRWQWFLRSGSLDVRLDDVRSTSWIKLSASVHVALVDASGLLLKDSYRKCEPLITLAVRNKHGKSSSKNVPVTEPQIFPARSRVRVNLLALRVHMYFVKPKTQLRGTAQTLDPTSAAA